VTGTTPRGTVGETDAAARVREMFGRVASRYDLANHLLSLNIDRSWRRKTVQAVRPVLERPGVRILDLCCGTGDLTLALAQERKGAVYGSDFCHSMLTAAQRKIRGAPLFESDALAMPLEDAGLDLITCAFGFRNLANYRSGLKEMYRVLRPGGMLAILEFSQPPNAAFGALYGLYSKHLLPVIGGLVSGAPDAYRYLPESVEKFPDAPAVASLMQAAGFCDVRFHRFTLGIVALHLARRPA